MNPLLVLGGLGLVGYWLYSRQQAPVKGTTTLPSGDLKPPVTGSEWFALVGSETTFPAAADKEVQAGQTVYFGVENADSTSKWAVKATVTEVGTYQGLPAVIAAVDKALVSLVPSNPAAVPVGTTVLIRQEDLLRGSVVETAATQQVSV